MKIGVAIIHALRTHSSKYILELSKYWVNWGYEVDVFVNTFDEFPEGVNVHRLPIPFKSFNAREAFFTLEATLAVNLAKLFKRYDITLAQATRFFTPSVCYQQFTYKAWARMNNYNDLRHRAIMWMEGRNLKKCKRVIVMSEKIKEEIIKWHGVGSEKIRVVYSGVDTTTFSPKNRKKYRKKIREECGVEKHDVLLLFVGNPYSRKGLDYLIKALSRVYDNFKLLILGRDLGEDRIENYLSLAKSLGIADKVIYAGFKKDIHKYFAASDIFVFPTLYEPFGLVILEAMASGLAVITSNPSYCGAAELIENEKEGLLLENPRNPSEIAEKINLLLKNRKLRKEISNKAKLKAKKYNWRDVARKWLNTFESIGSKL
jgi:UDP-glucose:(heptosyl)LPS alpha-1,3-glucosyltransferase